MTYDLKSDRIIIFGGAKGSSTIGLGDTWSYDYGTNTWTDMASLASPSARYYHAMAYDIESDRTILFGGSGGGDTWAYELSSNIWSNMASGTAPSPRSNHAMTYDSKHDRVILFGGRSSVILFDTWTYDFNTNTWANVTTSTRPSPRNNHDIAYDSQNDKTVLFGGCLVVSGGICTSYSSETWAYDYGSNTWANMNPGTGPSARAGHRMTYDSQSGRVVLFGGYGGSFMDDTWAYDLKNNTWKSMNPTTRPTGRYGHTMAYDSQNDRVILFGGWTTSSSTNDETWVYDLNANTWTNMNPTIRPSARNYPAMDHVVNGGRFVLFGGGDGSGAKGDTWTYEYGDISRPYVVSTIPANGATNVSITSKLSISWSEGMDHMATEGAVSFSPSVTCAWSWNGATMTCTPSANLQTGKQYTTTISTAAKDLAGNSMQNPYSFAFTTTFAPSVVSTSPTNGSTNISVTTSIVISFTLSMNKTATESAISASPSISGSFVWNSSENVLTFDPTPYLKQSTKYTITVSTGAKAKNGMALQAPYVFSFTTGISPPPRVTWTSPINSQKNVAINTDIVILFDQAMNRSSVEGAISASPGLTGSFAWDAFSTNVTWAPSADLYTCTNYVVTVARSAKSQVGMGMVSDFNLAFTTGGCDTTPPAVVSVSPKNAATNVPVNTSIQFDFSEPMDKWTVSLNISPYADGEVVWGIGTSMYYVLKAQLAFSTKYTMTVLSNASDIAGNQMLADFVSSFTTEAYKPKNGTLTGKVTSEGSTIQGVSISIYNSTSKALVKSAVTDSKGAFSVSLAPGRYDLTLEKNGYVTLKVTNIEILSGTTKNLPLTMERAIESASITLTLWLLLILIIAIVCCLILFAILRKRKVEEKVLPKTLPASEHAAPKPKPRPIARPPPLVIVPPPAQASTPEPEPRPSPPKENIWSGIEVNASTLIIDAAPDRAAQAFSALVTSGQSGLCASAIASETLRNGALRSLFVPKVKREGRQEYFEADTGTGKVEHVSPEKKASLPGERVKLIHLSAEKSADSIEPERIVALTARINKFMRENGKDGVVLVDDIGLIYEKNGWEPFEKSVSRLALTSRETTCTLLARMRPGSIPKERMAAIENKFYGVT